MSPEEAKKAKKSLRGIPGRKASEVDALAASLHGRDELWKPIENNQVGALQQLSTRSAIKQDRLAELLAADVAGISAGAAEFLTRQIPDLLAAAAVVALAFGLFFWRTPPAPPHVVARRALPAFHTLVADDLSDSKMAKDLLGRYTKQPVAKDATVAASDLGAAGVTLDGLQILRIALKQSPAAEGRETPYKASLIASSRESAVGMALTDVLVLTTTGGATPAATLALRPKDVEQLSKFVGVGDLYLAMPPP
jgi:hypothetical protein